MLAMLATAPWPWDWSPEAWTALAAWITLGVAALAATFARHQVLEARRTREEQAQPFIVVDFEPSEAWSGLMNLVIRNTGQTLAKNVKIRFSPPLQTTLSEDDAQFLLPESSLIKDGIATMPPGREYSVLFERMPDLFTSKLPRKYVATVSYCDSRERLYELEYVLDLGIYFGVMQVEVFTVHHAAKAARDIRDHVKMWTAHFNGLRVWVRDEDSYVAPQREDVESWKQEQWAEQAASEVRSPAHSDPDDPQVLR